MTSLIWLSSLGCNYIISSGSLNNMLHSFQNTHTLVTFEVVTSENWIPFVTPSDFPGFPTHQPAETDFGKCYEHPSPTRHTPKLPSIPFPFPTVDPLMQQVKHTLPDHDQPDEVG